MRAETTGRYVVLNGTKLYELAEYPEFGTQEYLDLPNAEARSRDDRYLGREQVEALNLEVFKEVKVPTGIGAVVQGVDGYMFTRAVTDAEDALPWISRNLCRYPNVSIINAIAEGGKVLSEGVEA